jgi:hypothetical protein
VYLRLDISVQFIHMKVSSFRIYSIPELKRNKEMKNRVLYSLFEDDNIPGDRTMRHVLVY